MAFETIEEWQVERRSFVLDGSVFALPDLPENLPFRKQLEKSPSAVFALVLHGLFLYFLISSAFDRAIDPALEQSSTSKTTMTMIELGDSLEEAIDPEPAAGARQVQPQPASPVESKLDTSIETELPPEWSVGRIKAPRTVTASSSEQVSNGADAGTGTGGAKGGGVYDPYAGASPNRKPEEEIALREDKPKKEATIAGRIAGFFGFGGDEEAVDTAAFERWVGSLRKRLPRAKGSVELSVSLDGQGKVKSAKIVGGTASFQVKFFVRNAAVGKQLAGGRASGKVELPVISFG